MAAGAGTTAKTAPDQDIIKIGHSSGVTEVDVKMDGERVIKGGVTRMLPVGAPAITTVDRVIEMVPELLDRVEGFVDKKRNKDF